MGKDVEILVTLSTFGDYSNQPLELLHHSPFGFKTNPYGRRMTPAEVIEMGRNCQGLIAGVEQYSAPTLAALPHLRCISRCGAGIDNIDLAAAQARGIAVLNTPDEPIAAVAELTLGLILALLRQLPKVDALTRDRQWQRVTGHLLADQTVGIIGLGRIGRRVAELVRAFGARVIATEPFPDLDWLQAQPIALMELPELLARSSIVSIHAATTPQTPLRLGAAELALMPPGSWLVNVARGDLVDDLALAVALETNHLRGAALDVFPQEPYHGPLCQSDRVILSPHQATLTLETRVAMEVRAVQNLIDYFLGQ